MSNNPLILIIQEHPGDYRLDMYGDFVRRFGFHYSNFKIYGKGYTETYSVEKSFDDIIKQDLNGIVPEICFMFSPDFKPSNMKQYNTKFYCFLSDSAHTNMAYISSIRVHDFECQGVFYNYLYGEELIKNAFGAKHKFYWPCWAGLKYDYKKCNMGKKNDFLLSGTITHEYSYRQKFRDIFRNSSMKNIDRYGMHKDEKNDNDLFWNLLASSRYCPHDGGINGRMQAKYYEASYMKSVIISPDLGKEMRINGFEHGINSILFDRNKPVTEITNMLINIDKFYDWNKLSENAYQLIKDRHTTDHRIRSFLEVVLC